jgi:hypothetical protein
MQTAAAVEGQPVRVRDGGLCREVGGDLRDRRSRVYVEAPELLHALRDTCAGLEHDADVGQGMPAAQLVNTLQLDRDKLLRWDSWTGPAKTYLKAQPEHFDLVPVIERYVNAAGQFAAWFWYEINVRTEVRRLSTKSLQRQWNSICGRKRTSARRTGSSKGLTSRRLAISSAAPSATDVAIDQGGNLGRCSFDSDSDSASATHPLSHLPHS